MAILVNSYFNEIIIDDFFRNFSSYGIALGLVYQNLVQLIGKFSNGLEFERHDKFGWLMTNLEMLGTGIRCKINVKLKQPVDCIKGICEKNCIKTTQNAHDVGNEFILELTNQKTFGLSEFECVKAFYDGVKEILQILAESESKTETIDSNSNETISQELVGNSDETINEACGSEENAEIVQLTTVDEDTAKNVANNEQKIENAQHEQVTSAVEGNEEKPQSEENALNSSEPNETNKDNSSEPNDTNLAQGENAAAENDGANTNESNENETNQQKIDDNENQSLKESDGKPTVEQATEESATEVQATQEPTTEEQPTDG